MRSPVRPPAPLAASPLPCQRPHFLPLLSGQDGVSDRHVQSERTVLEVREAFADLHLAAAARSPSTTPRKAGPSPLARRMDDARQMDDARWRGPAAHEALTLSWACARCGALSRCEVGVGCALGGHTSCAPLAGSLRLRGRLPLVCQGTGPVASSGRIRPWGALSRGLVGQCAAALPSGPSARSGICKSRALAPKPSEVTGPAPSLRLSDIASDVGERRFASQPGRFRADESVDREGR